MKWIIWMLLLSTRLVAQDYNLDMRKVEAFMQKALSSEKKAMEELEELRLQRTRIEDEIREAETKPSKDSKTLLKLLDAQLVSLKKQEKLAHKWLKEANDFLLDAKLANKLPPLKRNKKLGEMEQKYGHIPLETAASERVDSVSVTEVPVVAPPPVVPAPQTPSVDTTKKVLSGSEEMSEVENWRMANVPFAKYHPNQDVLLNPPMRECPVEFVGRDTFTGKYKKVLKPQLLFTHTEDFMRAAMGQKDYITCDVQVSQVQGGYTYLNLIFKIASRDAQRSFGLLDKGSPISFKFINGKNSVFANTKTDIGMLEASGQYTIYRATCELVGTAFKTLKDNELDVIRVAWSAGFEDYEVINMDVVQDLLKCLESK